MVEICIKLFVKDLGLFFILFDFAAIYLIFSGISELSKIFLTEA